jgi:hypothetical protein
MGLSANGWRIGPRDGLSDVVDMEILVDGARWNEGEIRDVVNTVKSWN